MLLSDVAERDQTAAASIGDQHVEAAATFGDRREEPIEWRAIGIVAADSGDVAVSCVGRDESTPTSEDAEGRDCLGMPHPV